MNQTRNFLLFALLAVAYFLFMAWEKDYMTPPPAPVASGSVANAASVPGVPSTPGGTPAISDASGPAGNAASSDSSVSVAAAEPLSSAHLRP